MKLKTDPQVFQKERCRFCDSKLSRPFLDLGTMPLANSFLKREQRDEEEFECPLQLTRCSVCSLVQLTHVAPPDLIFKNYLYVSSTTDTFRRHFAEYAGSVKRRLRRQEGIFAVDIGSNDGCLLECYKKEGMNAVGIEPAQNLSELANEKGLLTLNRYFDAVCVEEILSRYGQADIISANNVFAHIDGIQEVCRHISALLDREGIFTLEFPYLITMLEKMLFDMIYHEHLSYISVTALQYLFRNEGLKIFDIETVEAHGGSLRVFAEKEKGPYPVNETVEELRKSEEEGGYLSEERYQKFSKQVIGVKNKLLTYVRQLRSKGKSISGYGAPAKANTIINFCGLSANEIEYIIDDNPLKQNRFTPGAKIPVMPASYLEGHPTDFVIIFAWNFAREILKKISHLRARGVRFIVPLPEPSLVEEILT